MSRNATYICRYIGYIEEIISGIKMSNRCTCIHVCDNRERVTGEIMSHITCLVKLNIQLKRLTQINTQISSLSALRNNVVIQ